MNDLSRTRLHPLESKIPPPIVVLLVALAMWSATWLVPAFPLGRALRFTLAGILALLSLSCTAPAMFAFRRAGTTINPVDLAAASRLVTSGVYHWTRNPMYLGLTGLLFAWAVLLSTPALLLGPIVFVLFITRFQIIPEERVMRAKFGHEFEAYTNRVRRWL